MNFKSLFFSFFLYSFLIHSWAQDNNNLLVGDPNVDPTFETGISRGLWGGAAVVQNNAYEGNYSVRLGNNSYDQGGIELEVTNLSPRNTYVFSVYVKVTTGKLSVGAKGFNGDQSITKGAENSTYEQVSVKFSTGLGVTSAKIYVYNPTNRTTRGDVDNLELYDLGANNEIDIAPVDLNEYQLIFSDEFNEDGSIDDTKWKPERGFKRNNEAQYYLDRNLEQKNGNLVITAIRERFANENYDPNSSNWTRNREYANWTSGSINTSGKFNFLYGRVECRAKVSNLLGTWPAIWTVGQIASDVTYADEDLLGDCQTSAWPAAGEIDIMENYKGGILGNYAVAGNGRWKAKWDSRFVSISDFGDPEWADKYHIWTLDWTEDTMAIYVDGILINEGNPNWKNSSNSYACSDSAPFKGSPQMLWLNLAIGGNSGGNTSNLPDETTYLVDYIRVYQKKENIIDDPGFETGESTSLWGGSTVVASDPNTGTYAARLDDNSRYGGGYEALIGGLQPNTDYVFSAYVKTTGGRGRVGVKGHGRNEQSTAFENTAYEKVAIQFRTGNSSTSARVYVYNPTGGNGYIYADDLLLTQVSEVGKVFENNDLLNKEVVIFPNPITDKVYLSLPNDDVYEFKLMVMNGQVIKEGKVSNAQSIQVTDMLSGFYLLELRNGDVKKVEKIVIQK